MTSVWESVGVYAGVTFSVEVVSSQQVQIVML